MGGCASRPKELNFDIDPTPRVGPSIPEQALKNAQGEKAAQENKSGGESQKEEPLVDLSEPNSETPTTNGEISVESDTGIADLVSLMSESSDVDHVIAKKCEENVGAGNETKEQIKDRPGEVADLVGERGKKDVETHKADVAKMDHLLNPATMEGNGDPPLICA